MVPWNGVGACAWCRREPVAVTPFREGRLRRDEADEAVIPAKGPDLKNPGPAALVRRNRQLPASPAGGRRATPATVVGWRDAIFLGSGHCAVPPRSDEERKKNTKKEQKNLEP